MLFILNSFFLFFFFPFKFWIEMSVPPPQDEEEFPGLSLALTVSDRLTTSSNASKLCNEVRTLHFVSSQICFHNNYIIALLEMCFSPAF